MEFLKTHCLSIFFLLGIIWVGKVIYTQLKYKKNGVPIEALVIDHKVESGNYFPVYQFDYEEFRARHYPEGFFSYSEDGFGPVVTDPDSLLEELRRAEAAGFRMDPVYAARTENAFRYRDGQNCRRILEAVEEFRKKGGRKGEKRR